MHSEASTPEHPNIPCQVNAETRPTSSIYLIFQGKLHSTGAIARSAVHKL